MRFLSFLFWLFIAMCCALLLAVSGAFLYLSPNLPSVDSLRNIELQIPLRIYSNDGKLIAEYGEMRRNPLHFDQIPNNFVHALLSAEDDTFEQHHGVDPSSLFRASTQLLTTGHIQTGGSTITMQVAKNYFLTNDRTFSRKINEILLALQIEQELSKNEILELYVNKIYLGKRAYGIGAAAQVYYGKPLQELSLAQMAMIAGLPKAPSRYNPLANPKRAMQRRNWILGRMYSLSFITQEQRDEAIAEPITAKYHVKIPEVTAPYVAEVARAEMIKRYGSKAYTQGFRVITTVPSKLQNTARNAVHNGLITYDQRHGYRGPEKRLGLKDKIQWEKALSKEKPIGQLAPAIVSRIKNDGIVVLLRNGKEEPVKWETMKWARHFISNNAMGPRPKRPSSVVKIGDLVRIKRASDNSLRFAQIPKAQAALVSLDPSNGAILSMIGGFSFAQSNYNRATQAKRQPGSSFKPFIYSAAIDKGYTAASLFNDAPIVFATQDPNKAWRPKNDNNTFLGPIRLREALYKSRNLVSIRLLQAIGVNYARNYAARFGLPKQDLPPNLSLALGTADLTPMQIATGWTAFANDGYKISPHIIEQINDRNNKPLFIANPPIASTLKQLEKNKTKKNQETTKNSSDPADSSDTTETENVAEIRSSDPVMTPRIAKQIIDPRTAYIVTSMLKDVIKKGTGRRALVLKRNDLAGKTGTTNESKDAWFSGYNGDYVTTVWAGFDQPKTLGRHEFGSTVALPIWIDYMGHVLKGKPEHMAPQPIGIVRRRVSPKTGFAATASSPNAYFELFKKEDKIPKRSRQPSSSTKSSKENNLLDIF
ncbi:UNVERIFIED_CONTAM: hypothetical protein GTU68_023861 [Idotea baltica]|nr:hypothetical protein [Idotea baltica]